MNYFYRQLRRLQNAVRFGKRPWMSRSEYRLILEHLEPHHTLFEWGAGFSTAFFAPHVQQVHSVEHNEVWYHRVQHHAREQQLSNISLHLRPPDEPLTGTPNYERTSDARYRQFASYIQDIGARDVNTFDRVLIDGRSRPECAREALPHLHSESLVFIHDFYNRDAYHTIILDHYVPVASVRTGQTLVVLRPS